MQAHSDEAVDTGDRPAPGRRIRGLDADQRRAQRRRQLLDAALERFADQGYAHTSIEQICQTAYVGTKGFYELFDSKEACYLALLDEITSETSQKLVDALTDAPSDEDEATRLLVTTFVRALTDDPRRAEAAFGEGAGISPAVDRRRRANRRWAAHFVEEVWHRFGVTERAGHADLDLHRVAVGLIGGLFDLVIDRPTGPSPGATIRASDVDLLVDELLVFYQLVRAGIEARI